MHQKSVRTILNMDYLNRQINIDDSPLLREFLVSVFKIQAKTQNDLVNWKYFHSFFKGNGIQYGSFVSENGQTKLVSHYANLPITVSKNNTLYKSAICVDMGTISSYRGQGLISILSKEVYKKVVILGIDFSIGFSNESGIQVDRHSKGYGYQIVGRFQSYYFLAISRQKTGYLLNKINSPDRQLNLENDYYAIYKNQDYLFWRYVDNPSRAYEFYEVLNENKCVGIVVLKTSQSKLFIIDIILENINQDRLSQVVKSINNLAVSLGKRIIIYSVLDNKLWQKVLNRGLSFQKSVHNKYYLTVKIHDQSVNTDSTLLDANNWLCLVGDIL